MAQSAELRFKLVPELDEAKVNQMLAALRSSLATGAPLTLPGSDKAADGLKNVKDKAKETGDEIENLKNKAGGGTGGGIFGGIAKGAFEFNQINESVRNIGASLSDFGGGFVALDTATAKIRTLGEDSAKLAPAIRESAITLSKDLPFSAADFAGAMGDAVASGVKGGADALAGFSSTAAKLAVGGDADLGAVVKGLGANLNAFGKTAEDSGKFADILFNTVNAGVTTIDELNQYLSGVTPTAAAAGLGFENVGAALALMTQKGVPTAQATTKLNALLLEIQKPGKELASTFAAAGLSTEKLGEVMKSQGLPAALDLVKGAFDKAGKSATQAFSSSEAGAAFNILQGKAGEFAETLDTVANTTGSTEFAYQQMADTVENKQKQINTQIETFKTQALSAFPTGSAYALTFAQTLGSVAPQLTSLGALAPMLKSVGGGFVDLGGTLLKRFAPQLVAMATTGSISFASLGAAGTSALGAITAAIAANPIGAILVAITALAVGVAVAYKVLSKSTKEQAEEDLAGAEAAKKNTESQIAQNNERKKSLSGTQNLVKEYKELASKATTTAKEQDRLRAITRELDKQYPSLIDQTKSYKDNLAGVAEIGAKTNAELEITAKRNETLQKQLGENVKAIATAKRNIAIGELQDTLGEIDAAYIATFGLMNDEVQKFKTGFGQVRREFEIGLYNSKNLNDVENAYSKILEFVNQNAKLLNDSKKENEIRDAISKAVNAQKDALKEYGTVAKDVAETDKELKKAPPPPTDGKKTKAAKETNDALKEQLQLLDTLRKQTNEEFKGQTEQKAILEERSVTLREQLGIEQQKEAALAAQLVVLREAIKQGKLTVTSEAKPLTDADKTRLEKNMAGLTKELGTIDIKAKPEDAEAIKRKIATYAEQLKRGVTGGTVTVPVKSTADRESVQDAIDKVQEQIAAADQPQQILKAKITVEDVKETRRTLEQRVSELRADIQARVVPVIPARKELSALLNQQIADLALRMNATADPATRESLRETIKKLQTEVADTNKIIVRDEYIAAAPTAAQAAMRRTVADAEAAYAARVALSSRSADEEYADFNEYLNRKLEAEGLYLQKSRTANETALLDFSSSLSTNLQATFADAMKQSDEERDAARGREAQLEQEEDSIRRSYDRRLVNQAQFYDKMRELDEKRAAQTAESAAKQMGVWQAASKAIAESFSQMQTKSLADLSSTAAEVTKLSAAEVQFRDRKAAAEEKLASLTDTTTDDYKKAMEEKKVATAAFTQSTEAATSASERAWAQTANVVGAAMGQAIASGKNLMRAMVVAVLDSLNALVPVLSAQLLAVMISSPNPINVATLGAGGLAAYVGLNALMVAAIQGAKAVALSGFRKGGYTGDMPEDAVSGVTHGREWVFTASTTKKNRKHFERIHAEDLSIEEYVSKYLASSMPVATSGVSVKAARFSRTVAESNTQALEQLVARQTEAIVAESAKQRAALEKVAKRFTTHTTQEVKVEVKAKDHYVY
ncbi:MAG: phage tail tape measure protein [Candidatus Kapabacteria bacterium]|nr:phage tail tape measure protein [Candidatus Kapabacteria bacterium]